MVIFQKPNTSAIITFVGIVLSFLTEGVMQTLSVITGVVAGVIWSYREVTTGLNSIRKTFGFIGFLGIIVYLFMMLTS